MNRATTRSSRTAAAVAIVYILCSIAGSAARGQATSIVNTPHNLSASGPGAIRATAEQEICIFCHTPHNAAPLTPLWNRNVPVNAYTVYTSNSLDAVPGQPTGSSKLCLSCHDGAIAVGSVLSRDAPIQMAGGITTLPPGHGNLGTDLSDDHPISFRYDAALAARDPKLRHPSQLPPAVKLDRQQEMQCTSCHEPHNNINGNFLVMDNRNSQLCASCHNVGHTDIAAHAQCASCHQPHTAPSGPYLLRAVNVSDTCTSCHGGQTGSPQGANVLADLNKISRHDTQPDVTIKEHAPNHVACNDCHEPHTMLAAALPGAPAISPALGSIDGVNSAGAVIPRAQYQYEVCFKCHADNASVQPLVSRQIPQNNTRLEFAPSAVSFHPVEAPGKSADVPSLRPGLTTASMIYCTDCHASDSSPAAGGTGAKGPHGSNATPLLALTYITTDNTSESAQAYALCYSCHERSSILSNQSFSGHSTHIVDQRTPCSVCHDPHGIPSAQGNTTNNSRLINFDISIVKPDPVTGRLEYRNLGMRTGECYLSCHGADHSPRVYPAEAAPMLMPARGQRLRR